MAAQKISSLLIFLAVFFLGEVRAKSRSVKSAIVQVCGMVQ